MMTVPFVKSLLSWDLTSGCRIDNTLRYLHSFVTCCGSKPNTPVSPMDNISILLGPECIYQQHSNLIQYFENSLQESPINSGLHFGNQFMHYQEVNLKANRIAAFLQKIISKHEESSDRRPNKQYIFAIDISPSFELITAAIAVLKTGGILLPIDSLSAINRVKNMLYECKPLCLIVDSNSAFLKDTSDRMWSDFMIIDINNPDVYKHEAVYRSYMGNDITRNNIAAIIYTSGSTGVPKGVYLSHRAIINRLQFQWITFPFLNKNEVGCFKTSILFVDSLVEIFSCLLKQVSLVIVPVAITSNPEQFVQLLERHCVTRLTLVPALLRNILYYFSINGVRNRLFCLYLWISNSETLTPALLLHFFETFPDKTFVNIYGSTETMADVTYQFYHGKTDIINKQKDGNLSIGMPMINNHIYLLDDYGQIVQKGNIGEICVSGVNLASFYVGNNRDSFVDNPFIDIDGYGILYHTGDYGKIFNDMLIYEGRRDMQVKIGGQRVNISEIEKVVLECDKVNQVVVLCHKFSDISTVIVAYYVAKPNLNKHAVQSGIMDCCRESLPPYMRPKLVHVREIPLQIHTGKVDRVRLLRLYTRAFKRQSTIDLMNFDEKSQKVLNILGMNLNIPPTAIPQKVSFSELGGNSISMMSTIVQLKKYDLHIPIDKFSEASTVQDIINLVTESLDTEEQPQTAGFTIKVLNQIPNSEETIHLLSDSFIIKDPLDVLLGITKEEFMPFATSLYSAAVRDQLSFVVIDEESDKIVGGDFLFDLSQRKPVNHHENMTPILSLLRKFEEPVLERLVQEASGPLLFNFCLFVHKDLQYSEQVKLCHLIEGNVLQVARRYGFSGIVTNNTNPVTQDICEHFYGYQLLSKFRVADFIYNDRRVFGHAPQDYHIKMMIKYL